MAREITPLIKLGNPFLFFSGEVRQFSETGKAVADAFVRSFPVVNAVAPFIAITDKQGKFVVADADPSLVGPFTDGTVLSSRLEVVDPIFNRVIRRDIRGTVETPAPPNTTIAHLEEPFVLPEFLPPPFLDILGDIEPPMVSLLISGPSFFDGISITGIHCSLQ